MEEKFINKKLTLKEKMQLKIAYVKYRIVNPINEDSNFNANNEDIII